jgi:hypothetical protein
VGLDEGHTPSSPTGSPGCGFRYPEVTVVFADSLKFAEEWTYRFLAAALSDAGGDDPVAE